jgi:hypothetical protein
MKINLTKAEDDKLVELIVSLDLSYVIMMMWRMYA